MGQTGIVSLKRKLGSDRLDVRLDAIYALERIMIDSARDHPTIVEVLAAFVRHHLPAAASGPDPDTGEQPEQHPGPPTDLQAALTVLGRRPNGRTASGQVNLAGADLSGADLAGADLAGANLFGANLFGANLTEADLGCAALTGATLASANLTLANLTLADLTDADLTDADLTEAALDGADLTGVTLTHEQQTAINAN